MVGELFGAWAQAEIHAAGACPTCGGEVRLASSGGTVHRFAVEDEHDPELWHSVSRQAHPTSALGEYLFRCTDPGCARLTSLTLRGAAKVPPSLRR